MMQDYILYLIYYNKMELSERIKAIVDYSGITIPKYAQSIGAKTSQVIRDLLCGKTKSLSTDMRHKMLSYMPELNREWLLYGEGEMLKDSGQEIDQSTAEIKDAMMIPLIHIDIVGGVFSSNEIDASEQYLERMVPFPYGRKGDVAIMQSGTSMAPTIPAGAILQIRRVENRKEYLGYGNDFVLRLTDGRRITKQILKSEEDHKHYVRCHSYNPESADEELPKSMIQEVWKVVNVLINKGW